MEMLHFILKIKNIDLKEGEMLIVPKDTKYAFKGCFDAILIDSPAFDVKYDLIYDEQIKTSI